MGWWHMLQRLLLIRPQPHPEDLPPPIPELPDIPDDHQRLLDSTHYEIRHRERVLRALEAKANVRGNFKGG